MASENKSLKILCIHGYRQSSQSFRERTGAFRKIPIIKKSTELVFITAPNRVRSEGAEETVGFDDDEQMGWWFSSADREYMAQDYTDCCHGYKESLDVFTQVFKEQGPFDGIMGFSQGAAMASLLCGVQQQASLQPDSDNPIQFKFVISVAGFKSRQSSHESLYSVPISIPSLHVYGNTDKVIQKEMSEDLLKHFVEPKTLIHDGGHFIPTSSPQKKVYTEFLQQMLDKKYDTVKLWGH